MVPSAPLYILGTGLLAEEFYALAETSGFAVQAFVENLDPAKVGSTLCERSVIWVDTLPIDASCICALSTTTRTRFIEQVASRAAFATLVHPSSVVLPSTQLGEGTVVSTGVLIGSNSRIGRHVFLNRGSRVGHHTRIGDFVTIQPGANIAGAIEIGDESLHRHGRHHPRATQDRPRCYRGGRLGREARHSRPCARGRVTRRHQKARRRPSLAAYDSSASSMAGLRGGDRSAARRSGAADWPATEPSALRWNVSCKTGSAAEWCSRCPLRHTHSS